MESSNDNHSDCYKAMYKEGDTIFTFPETPKESFLNRTKR